MSDTIKIDKTFMKAMDQIDTLQKAFAKGGKFEAAISEVGGDTAIFEQLNTAFDSLYDSLEAAHYDAVGHVSENMTAPTRHMTLSEESFDGPRVGRKLQALAVKEPNDMIANAMATVADHLETWGATFGPKSMQDLVKKTGYSSEIIKMVIQRASKAVEESATITEAPFDGPRIGRKLQALAPKEPNDTIANAMANLADHLEDWGASFGPKSMQDLVKKTGLTAEVIKMLVQRAAKSNNPDYGTDKSVNEGVLEIAATFWFAKTALPIIIGGSLAALGLGGLAVVKVMDKIDSLRKLLKDKRMQKFIAANKGKELGDQEKSELLDIVPNNVRAEIKNDLESVTESVNEAGGYYTQPVYDLIAKHGYEKVMHELLTALHADVIQKFLAKGIDESVNEGRMSDKMIDDSEKMTKAEFVKKYGKEAADDMYESVAEAKDDKLHKQRDPNFVAMTKRKKGAHQDKKKMAKGGYEKHKSKMSESESAELDAIFEEIKLELKIKGM